MFICQSVSLLFSLVWVFCELRIQQLSLLKQRTSDMESSTSKYSWFLNNLACSLINYLININRLLHSHRRKLFGGDKMNWLVNRVDIILKQSLLVIWTSMTFLHYFIMIDFKNIIRWKDWGIYGLPKTLSWITMEAGFNYFSS